MSQSSNYYKMTFLFCSSFNHVSIANNKSSLNGHAVGTNQCYQTKLSVLFMIIFVLSIFILFFYMVYGSTWSWSSYGNLKNPLYLRWWSLNFVSCIYGFIFLMRFKVSVLAEKFNHASMHCAAVVIFSVHITVCLWCCLVYFSLSICHGWWSTYPVRINCCLFFLDQSLTRFGHL